jgi:hypothetical protein
MSSSLRAALIIAALSGCHIAKLEPPRPTCHDNAVVSCEACVDRGCAWCPEGPNASDGYCCETGGHCSQPITKALECAPIPACEQASVSACGDCLARNCAWCPGEARCHARGADGAFPSCPGRVAGAVECPAPPAGADP